MDRDSAFVGGIPDIYEDVLGPILFEPFARAVAEGFAGFEGRMLETAAGTGRLTRALLAAAPNAKIVATDLNAPMLEKAASLVGGDRVTWQTADALALPFDDGVFDAVACQFGVMFFPDRVKGYEEARRVLRTGGAFTFTAWDTLEANELTRVVQSAVATLFPDDPPNFFVRGPHGYSDEALIAREVRTAGFSSVEIERIRRPTPAASAEVAARALCLGTPLRNELEPRALGGLEPIVGAVANAIERHYGRGQISAPGSALVVRAR